jgi:hypothetical protein
VSGSSPNSLKSDGPSSNPDYNTVFERLRNLAEGNDLSASVAYSLYKESKREWVKEFRAHHARKPMDQELAQYSSTQTNSVLLAYLASANQVLATYAQSVIDDARPSIQRDALKGTFWSAVWPSFVASILFGVSLLILGLIAAYLGFGFPIQISVPPRS